MWWWCPACATHGHCLHLELSLHSSIFSESYRTEGYRVILPCLCSCFLHWSVCAFPYQCMNKATDLYIVILLACIKAFTYLHIRSVVAESTWRVYTSHPQNCNCANAAGMFYACMCYDVVGILIFVCSELVNKVNPKQLCMDETVVFIVIAPAKILM